MAATLIVVLITACGGVSDQGHGDDTVDPDAHPDLVDQDGLVAQHEFVLPAPDDEVLPHLDRPIDEGVAIIVEHDGIDARVVWTALSCRRAPEVEVTGQDGIVVAIDRGPRLAEDCDAIADFFAVDLTFRDDLQESSVEGRIR